MGYAKDFFEVVILGIFQPIKNFPGHIWGEVITLTMATIPASKLLFLFYPWTARVLAKMLFPFNG